ncbi:Translation machinery-associated protein 7 [Balamuthia mandrillaris]
MGLEEVEDKENKQEGCCETRHADNELRQSKQRNKPIASHPIDISSPKGSSQRQCRRHQGVHGLPERPALQQLSSFQHAAGPLLQMRGQQAASSATPTSSAAALSTSGNSPAAVTTTISNSLLNSKQASLPHSATSTPPSTAGAQAQFSRLLQTRGSWEPHLQPPPLRFPCKGRPGSPLPLLRSAPHQQEEEEEEAEEEVAKHTTSRSFQHNHFQSSSSEVCRAPLVGSFEESILCGRMGHLPKATFDGFSCDIGASGRNGFLPPHLRLTFTAAYYELDDESGYSRAAPPYVGTIHLGYNAAPYGYRVSSKGILQVTIYNPSKTPIKLFLVKYDLSDMPPYTKTFLRQKVLARPESRLVQSVSHLSASLPTTMAISSSSGLCQASFSATASKVRPRSLSLSSDQIEPCSYSEGVQQELLRYAIQVRFVCPKKKKYYLDNVIQVLFPFRKPDETEELRIVYDTPQSPKYYPWQPELFASDGDGKRQCDSEDQHRDHRIRRTRSCIVPEGRRNVRNRSKSLHTSD